MKRKILFFILLAIVFLIGFLHFSTPAELVLYHDAYRRLSYFPIVIGAIWFGVKGGMILAGLSSVAFIPHLLLYVGQGVQGYYSELAEVVLYLSAGLVVGIITEKERRLRLGYQQVSSQLEESYQHLHEGAAQLVEAEEQLAVAQKMSALGEMAASLAHEIRNPLSSVRGTAEILLDDYPAGHPKREFVEILLKETGHLEETLNNTLNFSKNDHAETEECETLSSVIRKHKLLLASRLKKGGIDLQLNGLEAGEHFLVPASRTSQVIFNILINAIDALEAKVPRAENVARLAVDENSQPLIRLDLEMTDAGCGLHICDNGPGVADELKEKIFEPFFSAKKEGTGLGLAISRKIVESYGGALQVTDSDLGGARFSMLLPPGLDRNSYHKLDLG